MPTPATDNWMRWVGGGCLGLIAAGLGLLYAIGASFNAALNAEDEDYGDIEDDEM